MQLTCIFLSSRKFDSLLYDCKQEAIKQCDLVTISEVITEEKEISPCLLFFIVNGEIKDKTLEYYCILCKEQVQLLFKPTVNAHKLMEHISRYLNIDRFIGSYPKMGNLLYSVDFNSYFKSDSKLKRSQQASIENMFQPNEKRRKKGEGERVVIDLCPGKLNRVNVQRLLCTIALNAPLSWYSKVKAISEDIANELCKYLCKDVQNEMKTLTTVKR